MVLLKDYKKFYMEANNMEDYRYKEIVQYLLDKIPLILDIEKQDLKFDKRDIHYKIYKYIHELREKNGER